MNINNIYTVNEHALAEWRRGRREALEEAIQRLTEKLKEDFPESPLVNSGNEVQRLREALEELQHLVDDEEGMHIINQALSTSEKEELAEIREFYRYHPEDNINKLNVNFLLSELDREREKNRNLANIGMNIEREIRSLIKDLDECDQPYEDIYDEIIKLVNKVIIRYAVERQKLIEGLRWYADRENFECHTMADVRPIIIDFGQRARDILKEIGIES